MSPVDVAVTVQGYLADGGNSPSNIDPTTGKGPEWGEAAPIGLLVLVLLCIAVYFLVKSLNRNLKKVPDTFVSVGARVPAGDQGASGQVSSTAPGAADGPGAQNPDATSGTGASPVPPTESR